MGKGDNSVLSVHVDDATPVHVHIKNKKMTKPLTSTVNPRFLNAKSKLTEAKTKSVLFFADSGNRRREATAHSRSKSPTWVPPPGKSSKGGKTVRSHTLDITDPEVDTLCITDLNTDDEDTVTSKMRHYERKIDGLMSEVSTLRNEVEIQRSLRETEVPSWRIETDQSDEPMPVLDVKDIDGYTDNNTSEFENTHHASTDILLNKLVETEMDSQAATKQVAALKDSIRRLKEEKRISSSDATMLTKQKDLVMQRLSDFENTNRTLRTMLRDRHEQEAASKRAAAHRDMLLRKLAETENEVQHYKTQVYEKDRLINDYKLQVDSQRQENIAISSFQSSLETTRAHLQKQLRQRDADCNRMAVQIKTLETQLAQELIDVDHLRQLLDAAREKAEKDKEALKKAIRAQKNRAAKSEDVVEHLNQQLLQHQSGVPGQKSELESLRTRCDKLTRERAQLAAENSGLKIRLSDLESLLEQIEYDTKAKVDNSTHRLQDKTSEAAQYKLDNERMKSTVSLVEEKLAQSEAEMKQLRTSLRQYENLVEEYRSQMNRSRRDADESIIQLDEAKRDITRLKQDGELALDEVRCRLQARLLELEPLPELMRTTELRLHEANEKLLSFERRNTESTKLIAELTAKVEQQAKEMEMFRDRDTYQRDDSRSIQVKMDSLNKKLQDMEIMNKELMSSVAKHEESLHQSNMKLDEKTRECHNLARQLESALTEVRLQTELAREKSSCKERATQSRLLELESQLSQARSEIARVKREKEEAERKYNSRLYDLKDRLEQSHSTNRSMQNYVQFLKSSYANVFGETSLNLSSSLNR